MEQHQRLLGRLRSLLIWCNVAMLCLGIGVTCLCPIGSWSGSPDGLIDYWLLSHHTEVIIWFLMASVIASVAVYSFVASGERAESETPEAVAGGRQGAQEA